MFGASAYKIHEPSTTIEFCQENRGISLRLFIFYPLKTRPDDASFTAALSQDSAAIAAHPHNQKL
jgi:hypothetical protein